MKILIADDHQLFLSGLRALFESEKEMEVCGEARTGREAISQTELLKPDVVIMDINMPDMNGIEATREILAIAPDTKILALSIHSGKEFVQAMLDAGAAGYIPKDDAPEELIKAIKIVNKGEMFLSPAVTRAALSKDEDERDLKGINILKTKLQCPPVLDDYIIRNRIVEELENNIVRPLSLISAGAGYGKSVAVSQWLEQTTYLYTWISLDEEHNDLRIFMTYLTEALEKIIPGCLQETGKAISGVELPPFKDLSYILFNDLCDIDQEMILVLDDYHKINNERIHKLLDEWLRFPPPNVHLSIITRRDPPMDEINSLRLSGRMTEIRMRTLSFTNDEIVQLFKQIVNIDLSDSAIQILHDKTEGWIIALRLASMLIKDGKDVDQLLPTYKGGVNTILDYLVSEVLSEQPENIKNQLLFSSIFNRFCADLLDEIWPMEEERYNGDEFIKLLHKDNMFVIKLDVEGRWNRYHHLFQELLQTQLKNKFTLEEENKARINASKWFEDNNLIEEAIKYAIDGGDTDRAVRIISSNWEVVSDADDFLTVDKWLNYLPEEVIQSSISLLFARFYSIFKGHRLEELPGIFGLILQSKSELSDAEKGYLAFINAMIHYYSAEGEKAASDAESALKHIPESYTSFRGDALTYWHISMLMIGKHTQALKVLKNKIQKFSEMKEYVQLGRSRHNVSFHALFTANLPFLRTATEEMSKTPQLSNFMLGFYYLNLQYICWFSNDLPGVVKESEKVVSVRYEFTSRLVIDCYIMKAIALQEMGMLDRADKVIADAIEFAEYIKDPSNLSVAYSGQARLKLNRGDLAEAIKWLNTTEHSDIDATMLWTVEVPAVTRCRILLASAKQTDIQLALELLTEYMNFSNSIFHKLQTIDIMVLLTIAYQKLNNKDKALKTLSAAIDIAVPGKWIRTFIELGDDIFDLLLQIKEEGIKSEFIEKIIGEINKREQITSIVSGKEIEKDQKEKLNLLTSRELEVLKCVALGLRNQEIASKLFNSEKTIKAHIYNMFQKMNVKNRLSLVVKAKEEGILVD